MKDCLLLEAERGFIYVLTSSVVHEERLERRQHNRDTFSVVFTTTTRGGGGGGNLQLSVCFSSAGNGRVVVFFSHLTPTHILGENIRLAALEHLIQLLVSHVVPG